MRDSRTTIVCRQPRMMIAQVQSSAVRPARGAGPRPQAVQAPACSATMRHGLDMRPPNSRCAPTAWPSVPTYAVRSAEIAAQYPAVGEQSPLWATPAKMSTSERRSGSSLKISPRRLALPEARATMPSSMLSQSRR